MKLVEFNPSPPVIWSKKEYETPPSVVCHHLNQVVVQMDGVDGGTEVVIQNPRHPFRAYDLTEDGGTVPTTEAHYRVVKTAPIIGGFQFSDEYALLEHTPRRVMP